MIWRLLRLAAIVTLVAMGALIFGVADDAWRWIVRVASRAGMSPPTGQPAELPPVVVAIGALVGVAAADPFRHGVGRAVSHAVTFLHELGHVLVAAACGARPAGIVLRHDASGHAASRWRTRRGLAPRLQRASTAFFGYPAPATFTAAGAALLVTFGPRAVLWALVGAAVLVAVLARSLWTMVVAGALGIVAFVSLSDAAAPYAATVAVAALVTIATNNVLTEGRRLFQPIGEGHDALSVREHLGVPAKFVQLVQTLWLAAAATFTLFAIVAATDW